MTLGELKMMIDDLERMHGDKVMNMDVYTEYDYGDHCHTRALAVPNDVFVEVPRESAYSDSGYARASDDDEEDEYGVEVVVLGSRTIY